MKTFELVLWYLIHGLMLAAMFFPLNAKAFDECPPHYLGSTVEGLIWNVKDAEIANKYINNGECARIFGEGYCVMEVRKLSENQHIITCTDKY